MNRNGKKRLIVVSSWIAGGLATLAIVGVILSSLFGGSSKPSQSMTITSSQSAVVKDVNHVDLSGTWTGTYADTTLMVAKIADNKITVTWVNKGTDTEALYWAGTFDTGDNPNKTFDVVSFADRDAMDGALMASQDQTKTFVYANGKIDFKLTITGITKTIHLSK